MYQTNHLPLLHMERSTTGCCPPFDPSQWDYQTFEFSDKPFFSMETKSILHIPLNMSSQMRRAQSIIREAGAETDEFIMMSKDTSPWRSEHYLAVSKDIPNQPMSHLSGRFMSRVFEGPYKNIENWYQQMQRYVEAKMETPLDTFFYYTTCPNCAKAYGKNYVVAMTRINGGGQNDV